MTTPVETEPKIVHLTILTMQLSITLFEVCKIGIPLHTSAKICVWNTNVYLA